MSFIPCTSNCKYQKDGVCTLEIAFFSSEMCEADCIHYVPKFSGKYGDFENKKKQPENSPKINFEGV